MCQRTKATNNAWRLNNKLLFITGAVDRVTYLKINVKMVKRFLRIKSLLTNMRKYRPKTQGGQVFTRNNNYFKYAFKCSYHLVWYRIPFYSGVC